MKVGKTAIVRHAYGVGKRVAKQTGEPFVKAQVSDCYRRNGGVYCSVQLDYTTLYCAGLNGATVYSGGHLVTELWATAANGDASCKHYAPKPKPKPKPSNYVSLSAGKAAIQSAANDISENLDAEGNYINDDSLSSCGQYGGGTGVFCNVTWDFADGVTCSSGARAAYLGGDLNVTFDDNGPNCG